MFCIKILKDLIKMSKFFKSKLFIVLIIITVVVASLMMISTAIGTPNFITNAVEFVVTPVSRLFYSAAGGVDNMFTSASQAGEYRTMYEQAQSKITELENQVREIDELRAENDRLRAILGFKEYNNQFETVAGQITAKEPGNMYADLKVNRGTNDGISKDDVVITDKGLVGYVSEAGNTWCKVRTILDPSSSVGCIVGRTGDRAIVEGSTELVDSGKCNMLYIAKGASVATGDSVETSGLGSIYPEGILIGKITQITPDVQGLYNQATVEASVDFDKIREVLIIVGKKQ